MDQVKCFKGCLPQILLGLFLSTLSHMFTSYVPIYFSYSIFLHFYPFGRSLKFFWCEKLLVKSRLDGEIVDNFTLIIFITHSIKGHFLLTL